MLVHVHVYLCMSVNKEKCVQVTTLSCECHTLVMIRDSEGIRGGHVGIVGRGCLALPLNIFVFYHFACLKECVLELKSEIHLNK